MTEIEFEYNQLTEPLKKHYANTLLLYNTPIKQVFQFNIYLFDDTLLSVNRDTRKLVFHSNEDLAIDYCLDNRNLK